MPQVSSTDVEAPTRASRGAWGKQIEFFLTIVGWAVGLGNIWRFPYLCYQHGGGTFLIPYLIMLVFVGFPIFFFELSLGQFSGVGPFQIWNLSPIFKGFGFAAVSITWMVSLYYNVLIAWSWRFLFACFTSVLPWTTCTNGWNTNACLEGPDLKALRAENGSLEEWLQNRSLTNADIKTPSEEYFYNEVLKISGGIDDPGAPVWELVLCLMLSWLVCFLVLIKGINSLGKAMYFVTTFPYIMMTVLVVRGALLEGAGDGVIAYLSPDFNALGNPQMWSDAATQIFYTLGTCSGGLVAMASFNPFRNNILRDSVIVPIINGLTSLYSGFAIFCVLGFMADMKGTEVKDVASQGPGLVFVVYPEGLSQMPAAPLWAFLFFLMILTLGYSSFSMVETVFIAIMDFFPDILRKDTKRPIIFRGVAIFIYFLITIPMITRGGFYLFDITNTFASGFPMIIVGIGEFAAVFWVYGQVRFADDVAMMLGKRPNIYFRTCWMVISPGLLIAIVIAVAIGYRPPQFGGYIYPAGANALGWIQVAFLLGWIPVTALFAIFTHSKCHPSQILKSVVFLSKPTPEWGPANPADRTGRYAPEPYSTSKELTQGEASRNDDIPMTSEIKKSEVTKSQNSGHDNEGFSSEKF